MSMPAIRVENLGKRYLVDHEARGTRGGYRTLRESLTDLAAAPLRRWQGKGSRTREEFWALNDVSFEVQPGEVVGIIGRNGAGKSTLLKILSQITKPTRGRVELNGRVGSLLEVGTGFHPELTGRENIYLNGSILGMSRREIDRKFDEIVAFAEIEKFLDTPVKRYSSGMYVRLAFSVAAHLEPEILLVDEVLAVGDAQFQSKCLGKMQAIKDSGRTVFLVSHQLSAICRLCTNVVYLDKGRLRSSGPTAKIVEEYVHNGATFQQSGEWLSLQGIRRTKSSDAFFTHVRFSSDQHFSRRPVYSGGPLFTAVRIHSDRHRLVPSIAVTIYDTFGTKLINADTIRHGDSLDLRPGINEVEVNIHHIYLNPGKYIVGLWLANGEMVFDYLTEAFEIEIEDVTTAALGTRPTWDGVVSCDFSCERLRLTQPSFVAN
jgi:ABC-type polysaccharide/polyol phosphate transport system ATPase subunit